VVVESDDAEEICQWNFEPESRTPEGLIRNKTVSVVKGV
jgi:hypothetical protein